MTRFSRAARRLVLAALVALVPIAAAAEEVDLELVLLADASGSIDDAEIRFQRAGYAEAMRDPAVLSAIRDGGLLGKIAVTYVEWASATSQQVVVDWMIIEDAASAATFGERLMEPPRLTVGSNAIGAALVKGLELIESNDYEGLRRVVDLSADSAWNPYPPTIREARDRLVGAGVTVNGLAILCTTCSGRPRRGDLEAAFRERLIGGPGAFVVTADGPENFVRGVRRKLVLEIADAARPAESSDTSDRDG